MSDEKRQLHNTIDTIPEEWAVKILEYIEFLKFASNDFGAPDSITIKSKQDLIDKINAGIEDTEKGNVVSFEEAFEEVEKIIEG